MNTCYNVGMGAGGYLKGQQGEPPRAPRLIRLLLYDEHTLFRQALRRVVTLEPDFLVVAEAKTAIEAVDQACELHPDVAIVSIDPPGVSGFEAIRHLHTALPEIGVIVLVNDARPQELSAVLEAGAHVYLGKSVAGEVLFRCIRQVALGETPLEKADMDNLLRSLRQCQTRLPELEKGQLGSRDVALLRLIAKGATNDEIAQALGISNQTVRNHLSDLYAMLRVENRTKAALYALQAGIASLGDE